MSLFGTFQGQNQTGEGGLWSRAHLHELMLDAAGRPASDESLNPARMDRLLTLAQAKWYNTISAVAPDALYGPPVQLTTTDGGYSYRFGTDDNGAPIDVMGHVEVLRGPGAHGVLLPGVSWGGGGFIVEGSIIRWPDGRPRLFAEGLYARYVARPHAIAEDREPTLMPKDARVLLVYDALRRWAPRVRRDPQEFADLEREAWFGDPQQGDHGILGRLRTQFNLTGAQAVDEERHDWWHFIDTGHSYIRHG